MHLPDASLDTALTRESLTAPGSCAREWPGYVGDCVTPPASVTLGLRTRAGAPRRGPPEGPRYLPIFIPVGP